MAAKKAADPTALARVNTGMEIVTELRAILDRAAANNGEMDDDTYAMLKTWNAAMEVKAENICLAKSSMEAQQAYFKSIEDAARSRRKALEASWGALKRYLAYLMAESGTTQIKKADGLFTISLQAGRSRCIVDNPDQLPADCCKVVEVINPATDEIKKRLEAGATVPGAHLETGEAFVTVRMAGASAKEE